MNEVKRIYLIGICGTAMGSLAGMLKESGYEVRGSDRNFYPPIGDFLKARNIGTDQGFDPKSIETFHPSLVVIGNVVSRDNPQAQYVMERKLPYTSFPEALRDLFLKGREPIVVMGTHGKTTTSAMIAHLLIEGARDPSVMIGGIVQRLQANYVLGGGSDFVVEGDEYDTAFFAKVPKFFYYMPKRAVLTSVEFDHGDIYKDIGEIERAFEKGVELIPPDGLLVYCAEDERVVSIAKKAKCERIAYAITPLRGVSDPMMTARIVKTEKDGTVFECERDGRRIPESPFFLSTAGRHNVLNAMASMLIAETRGVGPATVKRALSSYAGVKRRQEVIYEDDSYIVIEDFAHHPTAVRETVEAVQSRYPEHEVWAVFEPRSNTSRTNRFYEDYIAAFACARHVIIAGLPTSAGGRIYRKEGLKEEEPLHVPGIVKTLISKKIDAAVIDGTEAIIGRLMEKAKKPAVFLLMSNGAFDGIYGRLIDRIKLRRSS